MTKQNKPLWPYGDSCVVPVQVVNAEGSGTDSETLDAFDWALESLFLQLPGGRQCASALLCLINPPLWPPCLCLFRW